MSHDNKEPSATSNSGSLLNPERYDHKTTFKDPKTGKLSYDKQYLYLTLINGASNNLRIRITPQFKSDVKRTGKV